MAAIGDFHRHRQRLLKGRAAVPAGPVAGGASDDDEAAPEGARSLLQPGMLIEGERIGRHIVQDHGVEGTDL